MNKFGWVYIVEQLAALQWGNYNVESILESFRNSTIQPLVRELSVSRFYAALVLRLLW